MRTSRLLVSLHQIISSYYTNMKKIAFFLLAFVSVQNIQAEEYSFLTFETTDGAKASISVKSLSLNISGTTLTAGQQSFTLSNLSKMYFSSTDETTGIEEITSATLDEATDIYDLQGHKMTKAQMKKGIYIVKTKQGVHKILVK